MGVIVESAVTPTVIIAHSLISGASCASFIIIIVIIIELYSTNRNKATKEREQKYTVLKENQ